MILTQKRKVVLVASALALSIYGLTLVSRVSRRAGGSSQELRSPVLMDEGRDKFRMEQSAAGLSMQKSLALARARQASAEEFSMKKEASSPTPSPSPSPSPVPSPAPPAPSVRKATEGGRLLPLPAPSERLESSQKFIRAGQVSLEVKAFSSAFDRIQGIVTEVGGYISDIQVRRIEKERSQGTVTLRVPPAEYYRALNKLRPLGILENESSTIQDVTRQWLNLDVRIQHKREIEARMWGTVRNSPSDLNFLSDAENNLDGVNSGIEQLESERYKLQQDVLLSTITLELHEPALAVPVSPKPSVWTPLGSALKEAAAQVVLDISRLVYLGIVLLPWTLLGWLAWRGTRRPILRWMHSRAQASLEPLP